MAIPTLRAWIWTGLLLVACWMPGRWLHPDESRTPLGERNVDKLVHAALFAGFAYLWMRAPDMRRRMAWVVAIGLVLAVVTELGQWTPIVNRDADPMDALADAVGIAVGVCAARLASRSRVEPEVVSC